MAEFGKKTYLKKSGPLKISDKRIEGPYWSIQLVDGAYLFEYFSGAHGGGTKRCAITKEDFNDVGAGRISEYDLAIKYGLS